MPLLSTDLYPSQRATRQERPNRFPTLHSTSSAFCASALPDENWTIILDLAERRRMQNRIAQRKYRKRLKTRLEGLERRASSSSASPERPHNGSSISDCHASLHASSTSSSSSQLDISQLRRDSTPEAAARKHVLLPSEDCETLSQEYSSHISTSPTLFSYNSSARNETNRNHAPSVQSSMYWTTKRSKPTSEVSSFGPYMQPIQQAHANGVATPHARQDIWADDDISPFSVSYASIAGTGANLTVDQFYEDFLRLPM